MEPLVLTDKSIVPTDDLIFSIIGNNSIHWQNLMAGIHKNYHDAEGQWNYYNDGKNWLFKMVRKKKTLFWIGIHADTFRITYYFGDKAEPLLYNSDIAPELIDQFRNGKRYGKIRAISIRVQTAGDIINAIKLANIKVRV